MRLPPNDILAREHPDLESKVRGLSLPEDKNSCFMRPLSERIRGVSVYDVDFPAVPGRWGIDSAGSGRCC